MNIELLNSLKDKAFDAAKELTGGKDLKQELSGHAIDETIPASSAEGLHGRPDVERMGDSEKLSDWILDHSFEQTEDMDEGLAPDKEKTLGEALPESELDESFETKEIDRQVAKNIEESEILTPEQKGQLMSELQDNEYLSDLIQKDPSNIERWLNSQPVEIDDDAIARTDLGRRTNNYEKAGSTLYPHPAFNETMREGLERGDGAWYLGDDSYVVDNVATAERMGLERWQYKTVDELLEEYPDGVRYDEKGMPHFPEEALLKVDGQVVTERLEGGLTDDSNTDRRMATSQLEARGVEWDHGQYTWHHLPGTDDLVLVDWWIHRLTPHAGGRAIS